MNKKRITPAVVEPRKEPKQERSRQTYQDILHGAMRVIRRDGLHKLSTNKVAEESGVSIGSLYQYFPSKEAIIASLIEMGLEMEQQRIKAHIETLSPKLGARAVLKSIYSQFFNMSEEERTMRRALTLAVPLVDRNNEAILFNKALCELIINYCTENFKAPLENRDYEVVMYLAKYWTRALVQASVSDEVKNLNQETVLEEIADAVIGFLRIPPEYHNAMA